MTKRKTTIPTAFYIIIAAICVVGIIIGSFLDLDISKAIGSINGDNPFGAFFETIGLVPANLTIGISGALIGTAAIFTGKKIQGEGKKGLGIFLIVAGIAFMLATLVAGTYFICDALKGTKPAYDNYGYRIPSKIGAYIVSGVLQLAAMVATFFLTNHDDAPTLFKVGVIIAGAMLLQFLILHLLKKIGGRPRYRFLFGDLYNGSWEGESYVYQAWYEFHPSHPHIDPFKSWPSGHSATTACLLGIAYFPLTLKKRFKNDSIIVFVVAGIYCFTMMLGRIVAGAHYLSDVCTGMLIGTLVVFLISFAFEKILKKYPVALSEGSPTEATE